jgi:hypothetical protein
VVQRGSTKVQDLGEPGDSGKRALTRVQRPSVGSARVVGLRVEAISVDSPDTVLRPLHVDRSDGVVVAGPTPERRRGAQGDG